MKSAEEAEQLSRESSIFQIDFDQFGNDQGEDDMIEAGREDCQSQNSSKGSDSIDTKAPGMMHFQQHLNRPNVDYEIDEYWDCFGAKVPPAEIIFMSQLAVAGIIIFCCLLNLSLQIGNSNLWGILLSACAGYLLPAPSLEKSRKLVNKKNPEIGSLN